MFFGRYGKKRFVWTALACLLALAILGAILWGFQGAFFAVVAFIVVMGPIIWVGQRFGMSMANDAATYDMEA